MRVLLAFDKFKDSLSAPAACAAAAAAVQSVHPAAHLDSSPLADGGDGFASILTQAAGGELHVATVRGPRGAPVAAPFGLVPVQRLPAVVRTRLSLPATGGAVALVEMAAASGLARLAAAERDVWHTDTRGTGELLHAAKRAGACAIVLGVGGSATNDLGLGALTALGLRPLDASGGILPEVTPVHWPAITRFTGQVEPLPPVYLACDVTNPLLGPNGAAAVYGPQKGLPLKDVPRLDHAAARLALLLCTHYRRADTWMEAPGSGAAGGIAFGLRVAVGAELLPGFDFVASWLDLDTRIGAADVVLTGEGRFDESSMSGKGPGTVARRALTAGKPVHVFAGSVSLHGSLPPGLSVHPINPPELPLDRALVEAPERLAAAVRRALRG